MRSWPSRFLLAAALVLVAMAWNACRPAPAAPQARYEPTGSIEDIMLGMVEPSADAIFDSVAVIVSAAGVDERMPRTDEEWKRVEDAALTLAEAMNLLRMPGRVVAGANRRPPQSDAVPELTPEQIQQKIDADPAAFARYTGELLAQARRALDAARRKDVDGLFQVGGPIDDACESCHLVYWYPNAPQAP